MEANHGLPSEALRANRCNLLYNLLTQPYFNAHEAIRTAEGVKPSSLSVLEKSC